MELSASIFYTFFLSLFSFLFIYYSALSRSLALSLLFTLYLVCREFCRLLPTRLRGKLIYVERCKLFWVRQMQQTGNVTHGKRSEMYYIVEENPLSFLERIVSRLCQYFYLKIIVEIFTTFGIFIK